MKTAVQKSTTPTSDLIMRKTCACGRAMGPSGECAECRRKKMGVQTKLRVNEPGDRYEQEADRLADQIMRTSGPGQVTPLQTLSVQRSAEGEVVTASVESEALQLGSGRPLPAETRQFFESRFGHDFNQVRIHTDSHAVQTSGKLNAMAFTLGSHISFGRGAYAPQAVEGQRLIAHELTHVLQQRGFGSQLPDKHINSTSTLRNPSFSQPIIQRRSPDQVEEESKRNEETLQRIGGNIDVTVFSGDPDDPAKDTSKSIAEKRIKEGQTDLAFPINRIEDIHTTLQVIAWKNKLVPQSRIEKWESEGDFFLVPQNHPGFVRKLSVIGHGKAGKKGSEPFYAFGGIAYKTSELAAYYRSGLDLSRYMVGGGTVVLDGCNAAAGEPGRLFMMQIGLIFFGLKKRGFIRANTGEAIGFAGEMIGGGARTLAWPRDFDDKKVTCDPLENSPEGTVCVPEGDGFVLKPAQQ